MANKHRARNAQNKLKLIYLLCCNWVIFFTRPWYYLKPLGSSFHDGVQRTSAGRPFVHHETLMCFLLPCQPTFIFHLSYQLILRFRWIRFVTNSFEVWRRPPIPTPLQRIQNKNTGGALHCEPIILLLSSSLAGLATGIMGRKSPLHFNVEYSSGAPWSPFFPGDAWVLVCHTIQLHYGVGAFTRCTVGW